VSTTTTGKTVDPDSLRSLFEPKSVAVIGASERPASEGARMLRMLLQHGYSGDVYPINPRYDELQGHRAYPDIASVPGAVDVATVLVPGERVPDVLTQCAAAGVRNAVVFSAAVDGGFLASMPRDDAGRPAMRIVGNNCQGIANIARSVFLTYSPAVDLDAVGQPIRVGNVAVVAQSGALGYGVVDVGRARHMAFSFVATIGNELDLDAVDVVEHAVADDATEVIVLVIEGFRDGRRFREVARRAAEAGKRIVALKLGSSSAGARAAESHTSHLAGSDRVYDAVFRADDVVRAHDLQDLVDVAMALSRCPRSRGRRLGIIGTSGGAGVCIADAAESVGLEVPALGSKTVERLASLLPAYGSTSNPVDGTGDIVNTHSVAGVLEAVHADRDVDAVVLATSLANAAFFEPERADLKSLLARREKPIVLFSYTTPSAQSLALVDDIDVAWYTSQRQTALALEALLERSPDRRAAGDARRPAAVEEALRGLSNRKRSGSLLEYEAKDVLRQAGVVLPDGRLVTSADKAATAAVEIGFPVVLKIQADGLVHKSDVGGVELDLGDPEAVSEAFTRLMAIAGSHAADGAVRGVLVEAMARPGVEVIVGTVDDSDFGPQVMVGAGGIFTEVFDDVVIEPAPVSFPIAVDMVRRMRLWPLLAGSRGRPPADVDALADLIVTVSQLAAAGDPIEEVDLNPVCVLPEGQGIVVLDAFIGVAS
jgi:acetate---CoA ligase (ADP-forming)